MADIDTKELTVLNEDDGRAILKYRYKDCLLTCSKNLK